MRGNTISIRHYLNTRLKPRIINSDTNEIKEYPVYVALTTNKKTVNMKSLLDDYVQPEHFTQYLSVESTDIEKEKRVLIAKIQVGTLNQTINSTHYISPSKLNELRYAHLLELELDKLVDNFLEIGVEDCWNELLKESLDKYERIWNRADYNDKPLLPFSDDEYKSHILNRINISVFQGKPYKQPLKGLWQEGRHEINPFSFLLSQYIPDFRLLREKFPSELWNASTYIDKIKGANAVKRVSVIDYIDGSFDKLFLNVWHDTKALEAIHRGIEKLRSEYECLDAFMKTLT